MYDILMTLVHSVRITRHWDDYNNGNLFTSLYEADTEKRKYILGLERCKITLKWHLGFFFWQGSTKVKQHR